MWSRASEPPVTAELSAGAVIAGKYRIDGVLAQGGMGIVYRGWHLALEVPVAIKVMRLELAPRADSAMRFVNEARSAAQLGGQHIARVLDIGVLGDPPGGGALYMVMELLDGSDLRSILDREGPLPPDRAISYALGACDALAEVHAAGIVHRDIKPDNLFLARESGDTEIMKLLDFGISKNVHGDLGYETREGLGSPLYMAPEQLTNSADVDARADIWSLGVVLYELLSGRAPFEGENVARICAAVMDREPEPLWRACPHVSPALEAIVLRCLSKRPEDRFRTVHDLSFALQALQCVDGPGIPFLACRGPSGPAHRYPARQPERAIAARRQGRVRARPRNWKQRIALGAAAAAIASGIPVSTLLDALAARAPAPPATVQATPPLRTVEPPPSTRPGPVVCPVQGWEAGAIQTNGTPIPGDPAGVVRRGRPGSRAGASMPNGPFRPKSATPWPPAHAVIPLMPPYHSEPSQGAEAKSPNGSKPTQGAEQWAAELRSRL